MSTTSFSLPFQTLFSRKTRSGQQQQQQPARHSHATRKELLQDLVNSHGGPPSHTQSLPSGRSRSPPPTLRSRNGSLPRGTVRSSHQPAAVRGYRPGAGETHTFESLNGHKGQNGPQSGRYGPSGYGGTSGNDPHNGHDGRQYREDLRGHMDSRRTTISTNDSTRSQRCSGHYDCTHSSHRLEQSPIIIVNGQAAPPRSNYQHHQRHISRPVTILPSSPQPASTTASHGTVRSVRTSSSVSASPLLVGPYANGKGGRLRRYSENQVITPYGRSLPNHYVPHRTNPSSSGHGYGYDTTTVPSSATSAPAPSDWPMEESDEYDEDSEGPLDPLEVLESFYREIPLPPWMAAVLVDDATLTASHPMTAPGSLSYAQASQPDSSRRTASAMASSPVNAARSSSHIRSGFSLPFTTRPRIRRSSSVNNSSDNSSGSNKPPNTSILGHFLRSPGEQNNDDGVPIHQRPLPPVPAPAVTATASGTPSLRQRLLRSRHASDIPDDPSSIPEGTEVELTTNKRLSAQQSPTSDSEQPAGPLACHDVEHRPTSVVNHIIPPEERAEIGRRRYDSDSSLGSDDELSSASPSASIRLQLPPQLASMPSSPFGSTHTLPTHGLNPPPRLGLNPPPRLRSRMNPTSNAGPGWSWSPPSAHQPSPPSLLPSPIPSSPSTSALGPSFGVTPWATERTPLL